MRNIRTLWLLGIAAILALTGFMLLSDPELSDPEVGTVSAPVAERTTRRGGTTAVSELPPERQRATGPMGEGATASDVAHCEVVGRLVDERGAPIANVALRLAHVARSMWLLPAAEATHEFAFDLLGITTTSDRMGRFAFTRVALDGSLLIQAAPAGFAPLMRELDTGNAPGIRHDLGNLVLAAAQTLIGRVLTKDGAAVGGAVVRICSAQCDWLAAQRLDFLDLEGGAVAGDVAVLLPPWLQDIAKALPMFEATTRPDGSFRVDRPNAGDIVVAVFARGSGNYEPLRHGAGQPADGNLGDLVLSANEQVTGVVLDATQRYVASAEVLVASTKLAGWKIGPKPVAVSPEGAFTVRALEAGPFAVAVRQTSGDAWVVQHFSGERRHVVITLAARGSIAVRLHGPEWKEGGDAEVTVVPGTADSIAADVSRLGVFGQPRRASWDAVRREYRIDGLPIRTFVVNAKRGEWCGTPVTVTPGPSARCAVGMQLPAAWTFRVVGPDDNPAAKAKVVLNPNSVRPGTPTMPLELGLTSSDGILVTRTSFGGVPFSVLALHPLLGSASATVDQETDRNVLVRFSALGTVRGRVIPDFNSNITQWRVVLHREDSGNIKTPAAYFPSEDGAFVAGNLEPGRYIVSIRPRRLDGEQLLSSMGVAASDWRHNWSTSSVTVKAAEVADLGDLHTSPLISGRATSGRLLGRVQVHGGSGSPIWLSVFSAGRRSLVQADPGGTFVLGDVEAGDVSIRVFVERAGRNAAETLPQLVHVHKTLVRPAQETAVDISVQVGSVSGQVASGRRGPCSVSISADAFGIEQTVACDASGRFELGNLPYGQYRVFAAVGAARSGIVDVRLGEREPSVTLNLEVAGHFAVAGIVDATGLGEGALTGAKLMLVPLQPKPRQVSIVCDIVDGKFEAAGVAAGQWRLVLVGNSLPIGDGLRWEHSEDLYLSTEDVEDLVVVPVQRPR